MPHTYYFQKFQSSLIYDTLTIYPTVAEYKFMAPAIAECQECLNNEEVVFTKDGQNIYDSLREVNPQRYVHRNDDDHPLYHLDGYNMESEHSHLHYRAQLKKTQLLKILTIFERHHLITATEKSDFISSYEDRFKKERASIDAVIENVKPIVDHKPEPLGEKAMFWSETTLEDVEGKKNAIINWINSCNDTDILIDIHEYLMTEKFNFLRKKEDINKEKPHHDVDAQGKIVETTPFWAEIEHAIAAKIMCDIALHSNFTKRLASEKAKELGAAHPFMKVPHSPRDSKSIEGGFFKAAPESPTFKAFKESDTSALGYPTLGLG